MTLRTKLGVRPAPLVALVALVAKPDMPIAGLAAGVGFAVVFRGSCVLAVVLAAVAVAGG
jgi:hypothetical protein